jgi:hypothetical protein
MNSQLDDEFVACFRRLPAEIQQQSRRCYQLWRENPHHPSLQFKRIHRHENMYSVRIGLGWRALGLLEGNTITWFWIGTHSEYDRLIRKARHG